VTEVGGTQGVAHHGAWNDIPENTLAAFEHAVALGTDMIEVDVRRTRDGQPIAFHDAAVGGVPVARLDRPQDAQKTSR
jgi:glycerophosphoryl diester phosphodiesterase